MNKRNDRLVELVKQCGPEVILRVASICDGHTIFVPKVFVDAGLPAEIVEHLTTTHRSGGAPQSTLFVQGRTTPELRGVYGLDLLRFLADALSIEYQQPMGRGLEARKIHAALLRQLAPPAEPVVA